MVAQALTRPPLIPWSADGVKSRPALNSARVNALAFLFSFENERHSRAKKNDDDDGERKECKERAERKARITTAVITAAAKESDNCARERKRRPKTSMFAILVVFHGVLVSNNARVCSTRVPVYTRQCGTRPRATK